MDGCTKTACFGHLEFKLRFKIAVVVSDMPATASMLNMHHHQAKYGCTLCLVQTQIVGNTRFFSHKKFMLRTTELHDECLRKLESENLPAYRGVKGRSVLFGLVDNLPLAAPIDVMHQVYLGVAKVLLQVIRDETRRYYSESLARAVKTIEVQ